MDFDTARPYYKASCEATLEWIGWHDPAVMERRPGSCLVVGSAPAEALAIQQAGWQVTLVDVRPLPPLPGITTRQANALELPFADGAFDAVSSCCVLCHVGLGRYGDPAGSDWAMLHELARVLRSGGRMGLMPGPAAMQAVTIETTHRVYSPSSLSAIWPADLFIDAHRYFRPESKAWLEDDEVSADPYTPDYLWLGVHRAR